ncbi:MAG: hypothetical protein ABDH28_03600 [Brevinematia bacterium]
MVKGVTPKVVLLIISYVVSSAIVYMALTDSGVFEKRLESRLRIASKEVLKSFNKTLAKCKSITEAVSKDPNIKLIFLQAEIGGNKREYIGYLSRLRSSIAHVYKVVLLTADGNFLVSSEYFETEFKEFPVVRRYFDKRDFVFFGSFDVLYSIFKIYDQRGVEKGYVAVGWYKDLFKQPNLDTKSLKFVQDLVLVNFPDKVIGKVTGSTEFAKKAIVSEEVKEYGLTLLFFKPNVGLDPLKVIVIILSLAFTLLITIWFIVSILSDKKVEVMEEIREEVLSGMESGLMESYVDLYPQDQYTKETSVIPLEKKEHIEERYRYEEIETDIVPFVGGLAERNVATVNEVFEYLLQKLGVKKVMFMRRAEDGFVQISSVGFETNQFVVYFTDKVWDKFLSKGKAVSIKGDIKELYELGGRIVDDLFEIILFPVLDVSEQVRYLFVAGRRWTENEPGLEVKKEVFSKIKYLSIE